MIKKACDVYPNYTRLGSIGPDIPYFEKPITSARKMLLDFHMPLTPAAYVLHSKTPNLFAISLFRLVLKDVKDLAGEKQADLKLLAFAIGYLTHIATDHVIHPFVNANAGKYYVSDENKVRHRKIEIYQDVHVFEQMYQKDANNKKMDTKREFGNKDFEAKIDIVDESFSETFAEKLWDTELTFRVLLQRAFLETYGMEVTEKSIEDWVDGTVLTLRYLNRGLSPYSRALHKPKDKWKKLAFKVGEDIDTKFFYNPADPIVKFTKDVWRYEAGGRKAEEPDKSKLEGHLSEDKNTSRYGKAIVRSVQYIMYANEYVKDRNEDAFTDALPDWDLSDPQAN
jgi:hypothetical protein